MEFALALLTCIFLGVASLLLIVLILGLIYMMVTY